MPQQNQVWVFDFRLSVPKDKCQVWAEAMYEKVIDLIREDLDGDKFLFQLEDSHRDYTEEEHKAADQPHNLHFQGHFHACTKKRQAALVKAMAASETFSGWSKHIACASSKGKFALRKYCMKDKTRVAGPWADAPIYLGEDLITEATMSRQQVGLFRFLKTQNPIDWRRQAIWIYNPDGGGGKSALAKFCHFTMGWPMFSYAKTADILYIVSKFQNKKVYFFNLSKTKAADVSENDLYGAIESIKDGHFTSTKYESCSVLMNPCHVVIFANHVPNLKAMTQKRFVVYRWKQRPNLVVGDYSKFDMGCGPLMTVDQIQKEQAIALDDVIAVPNPLGFVPDHHHIHMS